MVTQIMFHNAHASRKIGLFEKKPRLMTALDLIKCLKQIDLHKFLRPCAPISELLTKVLSVVYRILIWSD